VDYQISSLGSDVDSIRRELMRISDRVSDLEMERERRRERWENLFLASAAFLSVMTMVLALCEAAAGHS
jgi:hypothetical protein